jgi:hypothetical protein
MGKELASKCRDEAGVSKNVGGLTAVLPGPQNEVDKAVEKR